MASIIDWAAPAQTCRFCKKMQVGSAGMVKYGVRHHAHYDCFLKAKGEAGLRSLPAWKVGAFPYVLLKEHGLLKVAQQITKEAR